MAVLINSTVQVHRLRDINEVKEILSVAKPDIVGMDITSAEIYDDVKYSFNVTKVMQSSSEETDKLLSKLTMLNITNGIDKPAIAAACAALRHAES